MARLQAKRVAKRREAGHGPDVRRGAYSISEQEIRRFDGTIMAALCVAAWIEDGADTSRPEAHVAAQIKETEALQRQLT